MKIIDYNFYLDYKSIEIEQNMAIVNLIESNEITFENNPEHPSAMDGLKHEILLLKVKGEWLIIYDDYDDDLTRLLRISSKEKLLENIQNNHNQIKLEIPVSTVQRPALHDSPTATKWQLFGYDNAMAVSYADANHDNPGPVPSSINNLQGWNFSSHLTL